MGRMEERAREEEMRSVRMLVKGAMTVVGDVWREAAVRLGGADMKLIRSLDLAAFVVCGMLLLRHGIVKYNLLKVY
jgi:hypothetical protein